MTPVAANWARALAVLCVGFITTASGAVQAVADGAAARREFMRDVSATLAREDFRALDAMADELWSQKARMPEGVWKLQLFYDAMTVQPAERKNADWKGLFARLDRWHAQQPSSATERIVRAHLLASYAWDARGNGYADTVTEEGWKLFAARLAQARELLDADPALQRWPGYFEVMLIIAMGEGWERPRYDRLFDRAVQLAPDYETFYFRKALNLQPKWSGRDESEWVEFARQSAAATRAEHGDEFYARIVWATLPPATATVEKFRAAGVEWSRMRAGFHDMARRYPASTWNRNAFCFYAYLMNDRETAAPLFEALQGKSAVEIWRSVAAFERAAEWARGGGR